MRVRILGPDATISSGGYYVQDDQGRFFHSSDVRVIEGSPEVPEGALPEVGDIEEGGQKPVPERGPDPTRRILGKRHPDAVRRLAALELGRSRLEEKHQRGCVVLEEEGHIRDRACGPGEDLPDLVNALTWENRSLEASIRALDLERKELVEQECLATPEWLQTVTVSAADVRRELDAWRPAALSEYRSLLEKGVIRPLGPGEQAKLEQACREQGKIFEVVPGKAVCTRKAPDGKRKVRGVVCGNFMEDRDVGDVYASGIDVAAVRAMIRNAASGYELATVDVKTAFLQVPAGRKEDATIVMPPRLFVEWGIVPPDERWLVEGTLYGTVTAPKEWGTYRDEVLVALRWGPDREWRLEKTPEPNLWRMQQWGSESEAWRTRGMVAVER